MNRIMPIVCAEYDEEKNAYDVEIQLPGAKKEDVDLKVMSGGFMVRAPRADEQETEYSGSYSFCCDVDEKKVTAKFDNGLLKANFPLRDPSEKARSVKVN